MGYPMTYKRVINRNNLATDWDGAGDPYAPRDHRLSMIRGDLRRFEHDSRDDLHLSTYARAAGITPEQARIVLDTLFGDHAMTTILTFTLRYPGPGALYEVGISKTGDSYAVRIVNQCEGSVDDIPATSLQQAMMIALAGCGISATVHDVNVPVASGVEVVR